MAIYGILGYFQIHKFSKMQASDRVTINLPGNADIVACYFEPPVEFSGKIQKWKCRECASMGKDAFTKQASDKVILTKVNHPNS